MPGHENSRRLAAGCGLVWLAVAGLSACSDPAVITLDVTPGQEVDAMSRTPAITRVDVTAQAPEGDLVLSASAAPGGSFSLGEVPETRLLSFEAQGIDVDARISLRGRSIAVVAGGVEGGVLPLFVQRVGEWARPPSGLSHATVGGIGVALGERYLMLAGGAAPASGGPSSTATPAYYDLLALGAAGGAALPRAPRSILMGTDGSSAVLVDDDGASWVDFVAGTVTELTEPAGLGSFADVAGGSVVDATDGSRYLVGATRTGTPTDAVLIWEPAQALRAARLGFARQGAAAAWLDGVGLVVAGGHDSAAGLEVLGAGASATATRPFPADPTVGAAAVARSAGQLLLVGGALQGVAAPTRVLDTACAFDCAPVVLDATLAPTLARCRGFALDADHVLVVGDDEDDAVDGGTAVAGLTRTFVLDLIDQQIDELELREPRAGAAVLATPHGLLALVGGMARDGAAATSVELLYPEVGSP